MAKIPVPLEDAVTLINHGPTVLISTSDPNLNRPNVFALAWITPVGFEPPTIMMVVSRENYSDQLISETGEFVVNIPDSSLVEKVDYCGNVSGRTVDKFKAAGLTAQDAQKVKAPLIKECIGHLECRVIEKKSWQGDSLYFAEILAAWADEGLFDKKWDMDNPRAHSVHHMGGHHYAIVGRHVEVRGR
ncbi:MAG TPA: flavin reductase family protein [Firmicutes bacterium]|nr:flavin reductase family protein [Bacillota bacterium]